jgi:N-acyl-D-aspartate/D-glutamate deacylase
MSDDTVRLRITVIGEYDAIPENYRDAPDDDVTPAQMAAIDQKSIEEGYLGEAIDWADPSTLQVKIEPV